MDMQRTPKWWGLIVLAAFVFTSSVYLFISLQDQHSSQWVSGIVHEGTSAEESSSALPANGPSSNQCGHASINLHPVQHSIRAPQHAELIWNISSGDRRPDGVAKRVYLINDASPGPTVEARSGDEIVVIVRNQLSGDEAIAIHWHGLRLSSEMDGVAKVTQPPIRPGQAFTYRLRVEDDQAGTFWYHAHSETQRADGLYGALIVHRPLDGPGQTDAERFDYAEDQVLMIGDHYHRAAVDVLDYYRDWKNFKIEPAPDSMLLNGHGSFNCSHAVPARPVDCVQVTSPCLQLHAGATRLRVINTGAASGFSLALKGYSITVVEVDGGNRVMPSAAVARIGTLYPGERVDVIVRRGVDIGEISIALDRENMRFPNLALSATQTFAVLPPTEPEPGARGTADGMVDLAAVSGLELPQDAVPQLANDTVLLYSTISYLAEYGNRPKGFVNHTSWDLPENMTVPLMQMDQSEWPPEHKALIRPVFRGVWVDVVLNNVDDKGHPFHLHGHDFFLLASHHPTRVGAHEPYNPFAATQPPGPGSLNIRNPIKKDTVYVPSMGYVVLRFKADSPGLWMFHCHVLWHQSVGMAMAFDVN